LPGVTEPGAGAVTTAASTRSPTPTAAVDPASTAVPSGGRAATISSREPPSATLEYSRTAPSKQAVAEADTATVTPPTPPALYPRSPAASPSGLVDAPTLPLARAGA